MLLAIFLVCHPDDAEVSAIKQRFWNQYHKDDGCYNLSNKFHLFRSTYNEKHYYQHNHLRSYRDWIHLYNEVTFLLVF